MKLAIIFVYLHWPTVGVTSVSETCKCRNQVTLTGRETFCQCKWGDTKKINGFGYLCKELLFTFSKVDLQNQSVWLELVLTCLCFVTNLGIYDIPGLAKILWVMSVAADLSQIWPTFESEKNFRKRTSNLKMTSLVRRREKRKPPGHYFGGGHIIAYHHCS